MNWLMMLMNEADHLSSLPNFRVSKGKISNCCTSICKSKLGPACIHHSVAFYLTTLHIFHITMPSQTFYFHLFNNSSECRTGRCVCVPSFASRGYC